MATVDHGSPSQFVGQPWSSWAEKVVGHKNKDTPSSTQGDEADGALEVPDEDTDKEQDKEQVMKLRIEDANVFGICPTQDEFYLVVCEQCSQVVKPQALERHMELRHGKPPDKPPDIPCQMEIMHSPPIRIPTTPRAPLCQQAQSSIPHAEYLDSHEGDSELSLPPRAASQPQPSELTFDTVLKPLSVHLVQRQESPHGYTVGRIREDASPVVSGKPNSPLDAQDAFSNLVSPTLPVVRIEKMSPQQANEASTLGISPVSLASSQQTTIELAPVPTGSIQCAPNLVPQQQAQSLAHHHQPAKPVPTAMVQLAPGPTTMMQTVKPGLVQPPPIQPAPAPTSLVKLAPAQPVQTKKNKKLSPKKNILCKDREFDVNKHCGVWVDADQRQCTRSLTCKTHALSLRRAVKGRRKPFDELLAEHKARSQALAAANNPSLLKKSTSLQQVPSSASSGSAHSSTTPQGVTRPSTPKATQTRPNTPKALTPKVLSPRPQAVGNLQVKSEASSKPLTVFQKIMPVPSPTKTYNLNSVLPAKKNPLLTPLESFPLEAASAQTKAPEVGLGSTNSSHTKPSEEEKTVDGEKEKSDYSCSHHHPRPVAMCSFGARQVGKGLYAFNRRLDYLRSTMAALVEKHSKPPPLKKMCLSSDSSQDLAAPMDTTPPSSEFQINSFTARSAASTSAFSLSSASPFDNTPSGSRTSLTTCNSSSSGTNTLSKSKSLPNTMCNNFNKGLTTSKKPSGKTSGKALSKSADGKTSSSLQHPVKNSKARRKSGPTGGKSNVGVSGSVTQNLFSGSSASPVTLTTGSSSYSIVTNSGLQPGDILSSGMVNLDPGSITNQELSSSLLKNLRFVVTNIEPNVNGGAVSNTAAPQTTGNFTVPILNATIGNTPVLLGNLGALALPYDGKLNVKSRTKSAGSGKSTVDRQGRRLSGSSTTASLQNVAIVSQPFIDSSTQDVIGVGAGVTVSERVTAANTCQPLQSPQSVPSPQLRPNSASPQLTSPLPNGIIPSPTNITFKPYPSTSITTPTTASANHVQRGMSPSRTSTPSPSPGSADTSPNVSGQLLAGSFNTSGKLALVSPKGSSHNLQKSTLNQKHSHHQHHRHRTVSQLSSQQQQQQLQQQQQQQQALQFHQLQLTPQQLQQQLQQQLSSLVAMDTQGKPLPLSSTLIPNLFQSIPAQQVGTGVLPGGLTLAPTVATEQGGKVLSQSAVLPQGAIALHLQQPGSGQPVRLSDQSQIGMSQEEDNRQELKMQH
ncbi:ataxin-7-like protein 1 isoform X2 [Acanthaster planci]|uniref:Ataxin-7-like protein 1 isoform X2 n=1 Tax=Acanthaster planci TaxID=133434 RepID=A0A8B7XP15_ACAPL|nr:ataxin-7-like protein 1 isoform X2 [Acanthaster planci]